MDVRWITAFLDRPADSITVATNFWCAASDSSLSQWRGDHREFASLLPGDGADPHLRVQRTETNGDVGLHIDLHVGDVRRAAARCTDLGAIVDADHGGYVSLTSPSGARFCVVVHRSEQRRQAPVRIGSAAGATLIDQVSIDVDPDVFDDEVNFWSAATGWPPRAARLGEFVPLERQPALPFRLMLQRRDRAAGRSTCHLDMACDDVPEAVAAQVALGAAVVSRFRYWTVMADPSGTPYCLTSRQPATGVLPPA